MIADGSEVVNLIYERIPVPLVPSDAIILTRAAEYDQLGCVTLQMTAKELVCSS